MNKKRKITRRIVAWFMCMTVVLTSFSLLTNNMVVYATNTSDRVIEVITDAACVLQTVSYSFTTSNTARGVWKLVLWKKGDTSGADGKPAIIKETNLATSDGSHTMAIDVQGEAGVTYAFGLYLAESTWSTNTSPDGWPHITTGCDYELLSGQVLGGGWTCFLAKNKS